MLLTGVTAHMGDLKLGRLGHLPIGHHIFCISLKTLAAAFPRVNMHTHALQKGSLFHTGFT